MAIELKFSKPDGGLHWGFRLVGGADFNEPLVVVKVNEDSLAEKAGLMVGDVVVRINNLPTSGLTHVDAHNLINQAGCDFLMAIRRGLFSDIPVASEEDGNAEIENIFNKTLAENFEGFEKVHEIGPSPRNLENLAGQEQVLEHVKVNNSNEGSKPKKWSTFLVKPKNPKPLSKKLESERTIISEPYKVKIVKQPRRDPYDVLYRKKSVQFEPLVTEVEISRDTSIADSTDSLEMSEETHLAELEIETSVKISEETTVEIRETNDDDNDDGDDQPTYQISDNESPDDTNEHEDQCTIKKIKPILKPGCLDIHIDPVICESSLSLEEQLAAVQKQLLTLSQLPSAIQVTLEAVTQQLNKIVLEKTTQVQENGYEDYESNNRECTNGFRESFGEEEEDIPDENVSVSENAEGDITENEADDQPSFDDLEHDHDGNGENVVQEKQLEETEQAEEPVETDPYAGLTEEEKEAKIREEKLLSKKQKIEEERRKMDWTQRPIVLPGGRKWSDPDDATPKLRKPKMSDEKICKAIEDHSELIVGKTKGINFLKYQPPPKNLDYLQKSEVYRLIHDMEPPVRGVGARAEIILSEKDYYQDRGAP